MLFFLLCIVGGWYFLFHSKNKGNPIVDNAKNNEEADKKAAAYLKQDKDGDGLADWAEYLLGTNPANPDSDEDGIFDGEEIQVNKNPLKRGDDAFGLSFGDEPQQSKGLTAYIAGNIAGQYVFSKESGANDKNFIADAITKELDSYIQNTGTFSDAYTMNDINIIPSDIQTSHQYANALAKSLKETFNDFSQSEIVLLNDILAKQTPERFQEFKKYENAYTKAATLLHSLSTPDAFASLHLSLLNNFTNLSRINAAFSNFEQDPAFALLHLTLYQHETERFKTFVKNMNTALEQSGIAFTELEDGFLFVEYYNQLKGQEII